MKRSNLRGVLGVGEHGAQPLDRLAAAAYPTVARAHEALAAACHEAGPLDARPRHLVKLAVGTALQLEGAVKSRARQALDAGVSEDEVRHAIVLSLTTSGFSRTVAAMKWVSEVLAARVAGRP